MPPMSTTDFCSSIRSMTGCGRLRVELGGVRAGEAADVARELDDAALQTEAQAEVRHAVLARVARGGDLAFDAAHAEPAGHDDAVEAREPAFGEQAFGVVGRDPVDHDLRAATRSRRASALRPPRGTRRAG